MADERISTILQGQQSRRVALQVIWLVVLTLVGIWLLYALRTVLLLLAFTVIFCYVLAPLVDLLTRPIRLGQRAWQLPRSLAISLVYLLLAGIVALAIDRLAPLLSDQLSAFADNLPNYVRQLDQYAKNLAALPTRYRLPMAWRQPLTDWLGSAQLNVVAWLQALTVKLVRLTLFLPWLILIPVLGFFFLKDAKTISQQMLSSLSAADLRFRVTLFLKDVSETLASYIRTQLIACVLVGVIEGLVLWLLGVPYPLVFAGRRHFGIHSCGGPFTLGGRQHWYPAFCPWNHALLVAGFLSIYRVVHDYVIYPRLISAGVEIHPVVVILAVLRARNWAVLTGVFSSVPVAALLIVCWRHWRDLQLDRAATLVTAEERPLIESYFAED
ncbi:MAG: AI-2E family transporter [Acidobacteriota bacterium]